MFTQTQLTEIRAAVARNSTAAEDRFRKCVAEEGMATAIRKWGPGVAALHLIQEHLDDLAAHINDPMAVLRWFSCYSQVVNDLREQYGEEYVRTILTPSLEQYVPVTTPAATTKIASQTVKTPA